MAEDLFSLIKRIALSKSIDPLLVLAIAKIESGVDTYKVRFEPKWRYFLDPDIYARHCGITLETERALQAMSFGPLQVMGAVARELIYNGPLIRLAEPELGVLYGCRKISSLCKKYPCEVDVISAYNQGTPIKINGYYKNQNYVDQVMTVLNRLRSGGSL